MKRASDILKELGFREDAPDSVKEAFLKHLIRASTGGEVETPSERRRRMVREWTRADEGRVPKGEKAAPEQLAFDFGKEPDPKKVG